MMGDSSDSLTVLLPPRYLGSVAYYALVNACRSVVVDSSMRFDKRMKEVHRCVIADTHGVKQLTVPIEKPVSMTAACWNDIVISPHGNWWHVHWETIKSAYGRTPFFEFYADDFASFYTVGAAGQSLCQFNRRLDETVRRLLYIESEVAYEVEATSGPVLDLRKKGTVDTNIEQSYYQVRAHRQGFIPGLSIIDLLFNLGPESALYLDRIASVLKKNFFIL